jgi:Tfp pilus assembly protein PilW
MRSITASSAAALVALAVLASGCSSGSGTTTSATPDPSPSSAATSPSGGGSSTPGSSSSGDASPSAPHATEFNPPGDIPDDAVFVDHTAPGSAVHFTVPEGWAKAASGDVTTFTDKYNSVSIEVRTRASAPTVASAKKEDLPELENTVPNYAPGEVTMVTRAHGTAVHITYLLDSEPNPVTDKVVRDVAERFEFWHAGEEAILTLTGPEHADNVDPWQIISDSLQWK